MIVDEARALVVLADRRTSLRQLVADAKKFATRQAQISSALARLRTVAEKASLFKTEGIGVPPVPASLTQVAQAVSQTNAAFVADHNAALGQIGDLEKRLADFVDLFSNSVESAWASYVRGKTRVGNEALLTVLEKIPDFKATVRKVRALTKDLQELAGVAPATSVVLQAFHSTVDAIAGEWEALGSDGVPQTIVDFLRLAVSVEGASLETFLVDAEIAKWLRDKKVMSAFRIKLA